MKKIIIIIAVFLFAVPCFSKELTGFGLNANVGTDTSLGLVAAAGASYLTVNDPEVSVEIGFNVYFSSFKESFAGEPPDDNKIYYNSEATIIYAIFANALFNYTPSKEGVYTVAGAGVGGVNLSWEKSSVDDPLYNDHGDDTGGSAIINLGVGGTFGNGFELRAQIPILITFMGFGGMKVSPALTVGAGLRM